MKCRWWLLVAAVPVLGGSDSAGSCCCNDMNGCGRSDAGAGSCGADYWWWWQLWKVLWP